MRNLVAVSITLLLTAFSSLQVQAADQVRAAIDPKESEIKWTGAKIVGGSHTGTVELASGYVVFKDHKPANGVVEVNMTTIKNSDVESPTWNKKLVDHLKSDDFFGSDKHPRSRITLQTIKHVKDSVFFVTGSLTIKGITKPVSFKATLKENKANKQIVQATFTFDRTSYGIKYNSGKFFDNLGDKMIRDQVEVNVSLSIKGLQKPIIL